METNEENIAAAGDEYILETIEKIVTNDNLKDSINLDVYERGRYVSDMKQRAKDNISLLERKPDFPDCMRNSSSPIDTYFKCSIDENNNKNLGELNSLINEIIRDYSDARLSVSDLKIRGAISGEYANFLTKIGRFCDASRVLLEHVEDPLTKRSSPDSLLVGRLIENMIGCQKKVIYGKDTMYYQPDNQTPQEANVEKLIWLLKQYETSPILLKSQKQKIMSSIITAFELYEKPPYDQLTAAKKINQSESLYKSLKYFVDTFSNPLCGIRINLQHSIKSIDSTLNNLKENGRSCNNS
jgi:hypothetical protein